MTKHGIQIDLDETVTNFTPAMASTHEIVVEADEEVKGEKPKKRNRESDEDDEDEDELEKYRREREKRTKVIEELEQKFEGDISDKTMENALEEVENGGATQAMTNKITKALKEAEEEIVVLENKMNDSIENDERAQVANLQRQLELKDTLLNGKDSKIIDLEEKVADLEKKLEDKEQVLKNKKILVKEKEKEIKDLVKKAKNITIAAGKSPSKEALKEKCLKHERTIENHLGRLKNLEGQKDNSVNAKLEKTINIQIKEIEMIKDTLKNFEAQAIKLKKKIPCDLRPCPYGRKNCQFSHDVEYKRASDSYQKKILCKFFAGQGCPLQEDQCKFSHSIELAVKATGGNQQPLGQKNDNSSFTSQASNSNAGKNSSNGFNNNQSVEVVADLSKYPANDDRRTAIKRRVPKQEARNDFPSNNFSGNGQGTSGRRSHQEDPHYRQRPHNSNSFHEQREDRNNFNWQQGDYTNRRGRYERDPRDQGYYQQRKRF